MKNKFLFLIGLFSLFIFPINVGASSANVALQQSAIREVANAYYRQGFEVQYDSYRKSLNATPEDATSQHPIYTVCSGLVYQVYYQTFGIKLPATTDELLAYARDNVSSNYSDYVLVYYDSKDKIFSNDVLGKNESNVAKIAEDWAKILQTGDIFVVSGHVMLIDRIDQDGTIYVVEAGGNAARYNYLKHEDGYDQENGNETIQYRDMERVLTYYYNKKNITELALIRPTQNGNKYLKQKGSINNYTYDEVEYNGITDSAKSRLDYSSIDIEKIVEISDGSSQGVFVNIGETLTYKITIKNNSDKAYSTFNVIENIDSNVKVVNYGDGELNDNGNLVWIKTLGAGASTVITYTVEVPTNKDLFGKKIVSTGKVDNIATSKIETLIGNKFTSNDKNKLLGAYNNLKNNSSVEMKFINDIYNEAFSVSIGVNKFSDVIGYNANISSSGGNSLSVKRTEVKDGSAKKYVYGNFYGLRTFGGVDKSVDANRDCPSAGLVYIYGNWNFTPMYELNDRARTITSDMLDDGDIILLSTSDVELTDSKTSCPVENLEDRSYIYLDNKLIRKTSSTSFEVLSGDVLDKFLRDIVGNNYVILKPSLDLGENLVDSEDEEEKTEGEDKVDDDELDDDKTDDQEKDDENEEKNPVTGLSNSLYIVALLVVSVCASFVVTIRKKKYFNK